MPPAGMRHRFFWHPCEEVYPLRRQRSTTRSGSQDGCVTAYPRILTHTTAQLPKPAAPVIPKSILSTQAYDSA